MKGGSRFVSMQNHYNLVYREEEREMIPLCVDQGIGIIPWSPLARGFLAGNRSRDKGGETTRSRSDDFAHGMYYQEEDFVTVDRVATVAKDMGKTMPQVALAWMLSKPYITSPIVGASKLPHSSRPWSHFRSSSIRTRSGSWRNPTGRTACSGTARQAQQGRSASARAGGGQLQ